MFGTDQQAITRLLTFKNRLSKLGIEIELIGNFPWIYLGKINGKTVTEKNEAKHGFTIAFYPIMENGKLKFTDLSKTFKLIRKYGKEK